MSGLPFSRTTGPCLDVIKRSGLESVISPEKLRFKRLNELDYWKKKKTAEGIFSRAHYPHFFTGHFGFEKDFWNGKSFWMWGADRGGPWNGPIVRPAESALIRWRSIIWTWGSKPTG